MERNDNRPALVEQGQEADATETPERMLLREILEALDLPWAASYDDRVVRLELLEGRVAYILGYVNSALDRGELTPGLAGAVSESMPVTYPVAEVNR